ncbi:hypothetical protein PXJ20_32395 [Paraburkholderia sp. A1RI_3L]|uniref:hypothetical protein n=1 Tax=Paraburkholderia TaxID=1822464 RepID=UPI003B7D66F0
MNALLVAVFKTVLLTVVMYFSVTALGGSPIVSLVLASIPIVFMVLSIYTGFAFRLVAVVFLIACAKTVIVGQDLSGPQVVGLLGSAASEVRETLRVVKP